MHDFGKENIRRLREVQRRCKEQEAHSRLVPVKALWTSSKYQSIPSKLTTQLQVRSVCARSKTFMYISSGLLLIQSVSLQQNSSPAVKPQCKNFLRAHSNYGSGGSLRPESKASTSAVQCCASRNSTQDQNLQVRIVNKDLLTYSYLLIHTHTNTKT